MPGPIADWFAVFTRPRQERRALVNLERQGFACFLPEASGGEDTRAEPLFPRYLFLRSGGREQDLAPVRSTRGVRALVRFGERLATVPEETIESIRRRIDSETGLVRLPRIALQRGDRVRIADGPLSGIEAVFEARSGQQRVLLLMELLGRRTPVEVDALSLRRAI